MNVLIICKYEEDPIKNRGARVFKTLYVNFSDTQGQITLESVVVSGRNLNSSKDFSRRSGAANSAVLDPIWPNFELI